MKFDIPSESEKKNWFKRYEMSLPKDGIINLMDTYKQYPIAVANLRVCISNIDIQLHCYGNSC